MEKSYTDKDLEELSEYYKSLRQRLTEKDENGISELDAYILLNGDEPTPKNKIIGYGN